MRAKQLFARLILSPVLLLLLAPASAQGAIVIRLSIKALVQESDLVVHGKVLGHRCFKDEETGKIFTAHTVTLLEILKGEKKPGQKVEVVTMGGELGDIGQLVPGEARIDDGEEVVLCLKQSRLGYVVTGMAQGKFSIVRPKGGKTILHRELGGLLLLRANGKKAEDAPGEVELDKFRSFVNALGAKK